MDTNKLTIQFFKFDEKNSKKDSVKCRHYNTAVVNIPGTYEELLQKCNYELLLILN